MSVYVMENDEWKIKISSHGAELISAVQKKDGREYMWDAKPEVWKRHSPILFPLVGRYKNDTSVFNGREYHMTQHGFARDMEFVTEFANASKTVFSLCESEETLEKYPFRFVLTVEYTLVGNSLTVKWTVKNTNDSKMYFSIGGHPAFTGGFDSLTDADIKFEADEDTISYRLINPSGLLGDIKEELKLDNKKMRITKHSFDRDALIFEMAGLRRVSIEKDGKPIVTVAMDVPLFGIWSSTGKDNPFICIEPWFGVVDREDFDGELQDRAYGNALEAGDVFMNEYVIFFGEQGCDAGVACADEKAVCGQ